MAKHTRSSRRPQAKHKKHAKSQHDKRRRLQRLNPKRRKTTAAHVPLSGTMQTAVSVLPAVLDRRIAFRLAIVVAGMFLADDRRTASAWFVAAGVRDDWDRFYDCLSSVGRTSGKLATAVLGLVVQKLAATCGDRILLAIDDTPTARYGPHVEGAGVHHHPTPGPADGEWLYGHNWAPYFCTDTSAEVRDILEAVAARWAIEEHFHDVKEVWGAGQQQVRNVWSNIGCRHLNQWAYTLVELCCWELEKSALSDRRARSWDNPDRRPSHADRRRRISREMLEKQFLAALPRTPDAGQFRTLLETLFALVT